MNSGNLKATNRKGTHGVRKKLRKTVVEYLQDILDDNKTKFEANLDMLSATSPKEYVKFVLDIYKLILPKQIESVNVHTAVDNATVMDFSQYSPQQLKRIHEAQQTLHEALVKPEIIQLPEDAA